jgi:hypothetical protein
VTLLFTIVAVFVLLRGLRDFFCTVTARTTRFLLQTTELFLAHGKPERDLDVARTDGLGVVPTRSVVGCRVGRPSTGDANVGVLLMLVHRHRVFPN